VLLLAGLVLGLLGWWLTTNFGFTTERTYVGYSGQARSNPYYAAGLLLGRMGKQVTQQTTLTAVDALPATATVVLPNARADMDPVLLHDLLAWVEAGGHVIAGVEAPFAKDPLLEAIGVRARWAEEHDDGAQKKPPVDEVTLPDGKILRARLGGAVVLNDPDQSASWRQSGPDGDSLLVFERGKGRIVVLSTLQPFTNPALDRFDHAALLWHFVQDAGPQVLLVRRIESVSLLAWLREHALAALAALGVLVALWLWRVVPRFGPLQPADIAQRRSLLEHLRAVGRFEADAQQLGRLVQQVREDAQAVFARLAPLAATLEGPARLREASRLAGLRPRDLLQAFEGNVSTRNEFSNAVRTLAAFRRRLVQRSRREETR
jgi:hypothetical protein